MRSMPCSAEKADFMPQIVPRTMRIGAVSYLNSKPLVERLDQLAADADLLLDLPSRLADQLAHRELDVALIPSVEFLRGDDYVVVSDACVATRGPVLSVKLYSRVHPGDIRRMDVDAGSRTSVALSQVLLAERYGVEPELSILPIDRSIADSTADAVLLIGDRAIHPPAERFQATWDLGEEWLKWTGLPFVFALWVARNDTPTDYLDQVLGQARDAGVSQLGAIARREACKLGIGVEQAEDYLRQNLHFQLGPAERHGLKLFQQLAGQLNLVPGEKNLVFRNQSSAG